MIDPRHICRAQLSACPGPCNPRLKTHYRHRNHHHRHREKFYDTSSEVTPAEEKFLQPKQLSSTLLQTFPKHDAQSFKSDVVAPGTSRDSESISKTPSFARIALIKDTSVPRIPQADVDLKFPSQGTFKIVESSVRTKVGKIELGTLVAGKIVSTSLATGTISYRQESPSISRSPIGRVLKALGDVKNAIARKSMKGSKPQRASILVPCLTIVTIYAGMHVLLAALAWQTPAHHFFVSSQICGILVLLMWRITGTILI